MQVDMFGPFVPPPPTVVTTAIGPTGPVQFSQIADLKRQPVWGYTGPSFEYMARQSLLREVAKQAKQEDDEILEFITTICS